MKRTFAAVTMAAAALATLSLTAPAVSAGAASQAASGQVHKTYAKGSAGYSMSGGGWRFRYIATTLTVPAPTTRATRAGIALGNENDALAMTVRAGGGPGSIWYEWSWEGENRPLALAPDVGDQVTISMYNDHKAGQASITAVDHTQGTSATEVTGANQVFTNAVVTGGGPTWSFASSRTRLWAFTDTRLTSVSGRHGAILGPWGTYRTIGTRGGTATGKVVLWPTWPWNNGHNFGIWWYAAS
jgi:hypothetical protein